MKAAFESATEAAVSLTLPSWDHSHTMDLKAMLTAMGFEEAMEVCTGFSGISPVGLFVGGLHRQPSGHTQGRRTRLTSKETASTAIHSWYRSSRLYEGESSVAGRGRPTPRAVPPRLCLADRFDQVWSVAADAADRLIDDTRELMSSGIDSGRCRISS